MAIDYTALASVATELIGDNGRAVTVRRRPETVPDPAKPWEPAEVALTPGADNVTAQAVNAELTSAQRGLTTIGMEARRYLIAYVAALSDFGVGWEILDGSEVFQVRDSDLIKPGPTAILFDCWAET